MEGRVAVKAKKSVWRAMSATTTRGKRMRGWGLGLAITLCLSLAVPGCAQDEALARKCHAIYVKLCKGIKNGPALAGKCNEKMPDVANKIPPECIEDFQNAVEGYDATKSR